MAFVWSVVWLCFLVSCTFLVLAALVVRQSLLPNLPSPPPSPPLFTATSERSIRRSATRTTLTHLATSSPAHSPLFSTIVVGSGLGGLTSAVLLSAESTRPLLVLEAHDVLGGCTHIFRAAGGLEFDSGVHYVGGEVWRSGSVFRLLLDVVTGGHVQWQPLHSGEQEWNDRGDALLTDTADPSRTNSDNEDDTHHVYDVLHFGDKTIRIRAGTQRYTDDLITLFPSEAAAIRDYIRLTQRIWAEAQLHFILRAFLPLWLYTAIGPRLLPNWHRYSQITTAQHLASITQCQALVDVLSYIYFDFGSLPASSSFAAHAVAHCYFYRGTAFPVGGASQIAKRAVQAIEAKGGKVLTRARVEEILVERGRAVGVRVRRAGSTAEESVRIYADRIVSAAGVHITYLNLLLPATRQLMPEVQLLAAEAAALKQAATHFSLYIAFRGDPIALNLPRHNTFVFPASNISAAGEQWAGEQSSDKWTAAAGDGLHACVGAVMIMFACRKDPTYVRRHPGLVTGQILCEANYEWVRQFEDEMKRRRGDVEADVTPVDSDVEVEEKGHNRGDVTGDSRATASSTSPAYTAMKEKMATHLFSHLYRHFPQLAHLPLLYHSLATPLSTNHYLNAPLGSSYSLAHTSDRFTSRLTRPAGGVPGLWLSGVDVGMAGLEGAVMGGVLCAAVMDWRVVWRLLSRVVGPHLRGRQRDGRDAERAGSARKGRPEAKKQQ